MNAITTTTKTGSKIVTTTDKSKWWNPFTWGEKEIHEELIDGVIEEKSSKMVPLNQFIEDQVQLSYERGKALGYESPYVTTMNKNKKSLLDKFNQRLDDRVDILKNEANKLNTKLQDILPGATIENDYKILVDKYNSEITRLTSDEERIKFNKNFASSFEEGFADGADKYTHEDAQGI